MDENSEVPSTANPESSAREFTPPQISLPKGGGAIRSIGEKFSANAVTGTGSLNVPLPVSPARSGFQPRLAVNYDSGAGNGAFGVGWSLSLPEISRKTDKGLPRYFDAEESDIFILSGAEDLVPVLKADTHPKWAVDECEHEGYRVKRYRPRVEGLFARIERWTRREDGDEYWQTFSRDNVLTLYGRTSESRIHDPADPKRIFRWLACASFDGKGNAIRYEYAAENEQGVDLEQPNERSRVRTANRYLKRIRYGNRVPLSRDAFADERAGWMFEVVFDFDDEGYEELPQDDRGREFVQVDATRKTSWSVRKDAFSNYRSGFEVRTHRLCKRVLLFHHFPDELSPTPYLVRSTEFGYDQKRIGSFLRRAVQSGYTRRHGGVYLKKNLPPLEMEYTISPLEDSRDEHFELREADDRNFPAGIDGADYRWLDLDGVGISGVLSEQGSGWYYKRNLGGGRFGPMELVSEKPSIGRLRRSLQQLLDVGGDGNLDLVDFAAGAAGFYERTAESGWAGFRAFPSLPVVEWNDPNLKFVDVTGDGVADILISDNVDFQWHPSYLQSGFGSAVRVPAAQHEDKGPRLVFADPEQSVYLADMSGDGLTDIVRIRNGEVCYWPNLGYGHFGAKVMMDRSPWFDVPDLFQQQRIRLADTDGSGTADILYIGADGIHVYLNESGNSWSEDKLLKDIFCDDITSVTVTDFLGRGTACLVWSSTLPSDAARPLRYVDLMRGRKPHLLDRVRNNLGAETAIEYASSTEFYLADGAAGRPWVTRLPFPVHVVKRIETYDYISRNRFVTRKAYHHGYFDGIEREFRGFGCVEQLDTEEIGVLTEPAIEGRAHNEGTSSNVPPVLTKTWYHTGVFLGADRISRHLAHEYYREPDQNPEMLLDDTILPGGLTPDEAREGCRALKGSMLRQEVYALDGAEESSRPYAVSEGNFTIRPLQPRESNRYAVFFTCSRESLSVHYERKLYRVGGERRADPRVTHAFTLEVDAYGNVLKSVNVGYGRRIPDSSGALTPEDRRKQEQILLVLAESDYTNAVRHFDAHWNPLPAETRSYELVKMAPGAQRPGATNLFRFDEMRRKAAQASDGLHDLPYEDLDAGGAVANHPYRRLVQRSRTVYRSDDLRSFLPVGELQSLALPGEKYQLAFTPGLIAEVYRRRMDDRSFENLLPHPGAVLAGEGGYLDLDADGHWWTPSGRLFFSPRAADTPAEELTYARQHFFLPHRYMDAFGNTSSVGFDAHDFSPVETLDPVGNRTTCETDYRVLAPERVTDANGNRAQAAFDALGMVAGTALMGKEGERVGDSLAGFVADLDEATTFHHVRHPLDDPQQILGDATTRLVYDLFAYARTRSDRQPQPAVTYQLSRETHAASLAPGQQTKVQHTFAYSDGFGRVVQNKVQAAPGRLGATKPIADPRWIASGWTIYDNKGKPVKKYEPFFTTTPEFEFARIEGVSSTLFYDPVGRVVATLHPDHTFEKAIFDPWRQQMWDVNDTVLEINPARDPDVGGFFARVPNDEYLPTWYEARIHGALGTEARKAAAQTAGHAATPKDVYLDTLGRNFLSVDLNRFERDGRPVEERYATRSELDIEGHQRWITDPLDRRIISYRYGMTGAKISQSSADAGERWVLYDVLGKLLLSWNSRRFRFRYEYDGAHRPTKLFVARDGDGEELAEKIVYGEGLPQDVALNLRGKIARQLDGAGVAANDEFDFKGNVLQSSRQFLHDYRDGVDWSVAPALEDRIYRTGKAYDALNRVVSITTPDSSVASPEYNEANLLDKLSVDLLGGGSFTAYVTGIEYNAKGQREEISHGNGVRTRYEYDQRTFRLTHLHTMREEDRAGLQDLHYTYDPVGNIIAIVDRAQETVYFRNQAVAPSNHYLYDAIYRLIHADGRELIGLLRDPQTTWDDAPRTSQPLPGDGQAMRRYGESYHYDSVGNILEILHSATDGSWRRYYSYPESSNRLSHTRVGELREDYDYDAAGNIIRMPHLPEMVWDCKDQLHRTQQQAFREDPRESTWYVYNTTGQRLRKITERGGRKQNERIYVGGFEVYRQYAQDGEVEFERETLQVMDDQRRIALVETKRIDRKEAFGALPFSLVRYQFGNHLDSAVLELSASADIISYEEYYPYGSTSYQSVRRDVEASPKRYRYTAKERDTETGFYYHGARYYAPWLARWASCDLMVLGGGANLYAFVSGNPIRLIDGTGHAPATSPLDPDPLPRSSVDYEGGVPTKKASNAQWQADRNAHTRASRALKGVESEGGRYQEHHTLDVDAAKKANVDPKIAGEPERMMTLGSRREGMPTGTINGETLTHHNVVAGYGKDVQARTGGSPEGLVDASTETVWKFNNTGADPTSKIPIAADAATGQATQWGTVRDNPMPRPIVQAELSTFDLDAALKSPGLRAAQAANASEAERLGINTSEFNDMLYGKTSLSAQSGAASVEGAFGLGMFGLGIAFAAPRAIEAQERGDAVGAVLAWSTAVPGIGIYGAVLEQGYNVAVAVNALEIAWGKSGMIEAGYTSPLQAITTNEIPAGATKPPTTSASEAQANMLELLTGMRFSWF
jgi:RHS repeat-associated protein